MQKYIPSAMAIAMLMFAACSGAQQERPVLPLPQINEDQRPWLTILGQRVRSQAHSRCGGKEHPDWHVHLYWGEDTDVVACPFRAGCYPNNIPVDPNSDENCVDYERCMVSEIGTPNKVPCALFFPAPHAE